MGNLGLVGVKTSPDLSQEVSGQSSPSLVQRLTQLLEEGEWDREEAGKRLTGGWGLSTGSEELRGLVPPTVMLGCEQILPTQHRAWHS